MQKCDKIRLMQVKELMKIDYIKKAVDFIDTKIEERSNRLLDGYSFNYNDMFTSEDGMKNILPYAVRGYYGERDKLAFNLAKIYTVQGFNCTIQNDMLHIKFFPTIIC